MSTIPEILDYVRFGRAALLEAIAGLSQREMAELPIYPEWTIKDLLAHIIGWDRRVLSILPLIVADRAAEVPGVDVEPHNRQAVAALKDWSLIAVLGEFQATHQQILSFLSSIAYEEIDRRHERNGRYITIRSYVIQIMVEHERRHASEIQAWRQQLDRALDLRGLKLACMQQRADFMALLDRCTDAEVYDQRAVGSWSINDLIGHLADWEQRMLKAARHIHDPSQPAVPPVSDSDADWNTIMAARRAGKSWAENYHDLRETQRAVDDFVAGLRSGDWTLRGPYPWPDDQGTLAELVTRIGEHYADHVPAVVRWNERQNREG